MEDILHHTFSVLSIKEILKCRFINKFLNDVCMSESIWKILLQRDFCGVKLVFNTYFETYKLCVKLKKFKITIDQIHTYSPKEDYSLDHLYNSEFLYLHNTKFLAILKEVDAPIIHNNPTGPGCLKNLNGSPFLKMVPELGVLTNLKQLILKDNYFMSFPEEIKELYNLEILDLSFNNFCIIPTIIGNLHNLRELYLNHTSIISVPTELGNLCNLTLLNLSCNTISIIPTEFGKLSSIITLNLFFNKIVALPIEICNLSTLKFLHYYSNPNIIIPEEILTMPNLQIM